MAKKEGQTAMRGSGHPTRVSRRRMLRATVGLTGLGAAAFLAACGASAPPTAAPAPTEPAKPAAAVATKPAEPAKPAAAAATKPAEPTKPAGQTPTPAAAAAPQTRQAATIRWQSPFPNPTSNELIQPLITKLEQQNAGIKVEPEAKLPWDKLTATFIAGTAADLVWGCCEHTANWITQKLALDLNNYVTNWPDAKAFIPPQYNWFQRQGHQFAIPVYCATHAWFYNKEIFDKMKVPYPTKDDFTWQELRPMSKALTKRTGDQVDWFGMEAYMNWDWEVAYMLWANGARPYRDDSNSVVTLDDPKALELLQWWADARWVGKSNPTAEQAKLSQTVGFTAVQSGKSAATVLGSWFIYPQTETSKFAWGLFAAPRGTTGERRTQQTTDAMIIFQGSKAKDQAWEVMKFGTGEEWESAAMQPKGGMLQPSRVALQPKWAGIVLEHVKTVNPAITKEDVDIFANAYKYASPQPIFSDHAKAMEILGPAWDQVFKTGTAQAKDVIPPAVKQVNAALKDVPSTLPT